MFLGDGDQEAKFRVSGKTDVRNYLYQSSNRKDYEDTSYVGTDSQPQVGGCL